MGAAFPSGRGGGAGGAAWAKAWEESPGREAGGAPGVGNTSRGRGARAPTHRVSEPLLGLAAPDIGSQDDLGSLGLQFLHL